MRTIIEEHEVTALLAAESKKYARLEEIFDGLKWRLARQPDHTSAVPVPVPGVGVACYYLMKTPSWKVDGAAIITALYTFTDNEVTIVSVRISDPEDA